jgi:hypothetical protein
MPKREGHGWVTAVVLVVLFAAVACLFFLMRGRDDTQATEAICAAFSSTVLPYVIAVGALACAIASILLQLCAARRQKPRIKELEAKLSDLREKVARETPESYRLTKEEWTRNTVKLAELDRYVKDNLDIVNKYPPGAATEENQQLFGGRAPQDSVISSGAWLQRETSSSSSGLGYNAPTAPAPSEGENVLYASVVEGDGLFKDLRPSRDWDSLYMLTSIGPLAASTRATVTLCDNHEVFPRAILDHHLLLDPVCHYRANPSDTAKTIIMHRPGTAQKARGDGWRIDDKLEIEFR